MSRRVYNIDLYIIMHDRAVLGINCDSALTLDSIAVHDAVHNFLVLAKHVALCEERVHQCRFSGINVRNYSDINDFLFITHVCPFFSFSKLTTNNSTEKHYIQYCSLAGNLRPARVSAEINHCCQPLRLQSTGSSPQFSRKALVLEK